MRTPVKDAPIRIVKKEKGHHGHHGGAWKVAYADFVSAMMALFIVLWIVGQSKQVKQAIAGYFRDPEAFSESSKSGGGLGSLFPGKGRGVLEGENLSIKEEVLEELNREAQEKKLKQMGETILIELGKEAQLQRLLDQVKFEIVKEGLRIELLETSESFFFDIGTSQLKPEAAQIFATIAREIGKLPNHVIIEGHTDSRKYSKANGYTNFELSADRANSARRILVTQGLREGQIDEIRGYADTKLRNKNDRFDATNRRISIMIKFEGESKDG